MEFNKKLQILRKNKNLTQEELAAKLFVSRTAISKWESGRGFPSIDSLKVIAEFFSITVDQLISSSESIDDCDEQCIKGNKINKDLLFGLIDIVMIILVFLPFFASKSTGIIIESSLINLIGISVYLKSLFYISVIANFLYGILTLCLQNINIIFFIKYKYLISIILTISTTLLFIISLQPYAAIFTFIFLIIKLILLIKI